MPDTGDIIGGRYRLDSVLGEGGMGTVYQATDSQGGETVALKILHADRCDDESAVERFRREAWAAAAIGHPAIVDVLDSGVCDEESFFIVMDRLEGQTLSDCIADEGMLPVGLSAYIACQVLSGLSAAHQAGIIHRDLKPENVFLVGGEGVPEVKLLDFGVSKIVCEQIEIQKLTATGAMLGTPTYMSPEQARGETNLDRRADVYSVGVLLYESLTGLTPFRGDSYTEICTAILTESPMEPSQLNLDVTPELEAVILRALDKDRDTRFASASQLFRALLPFVDPRLAGRISTPDESSRPTFDSGRLTPLAAASSPGQAVARSSDPPALSGPPACHSPEVDAPPPAARGGGKLLPLVLALLAGIAVLGGVAAWLVWG